MERHLKIKLPLRSSELIHGHLLTVSSSYCGEERREKVERRERGEEEQWEEGM